MGGGTMLTSLRLWKRPLKLTRFLPKATQYLGLFGLAGSASFPFRAERFVLNVVPPQTDAKSQAPAAQQINLRRLLRDHPESDAAARSERRLRA